MQYSSPRGILKLFSMNTKTFVWGGLCVGSTIGGLLPYFWNGGLFSYTLMSAVGGIVGIYLGFKLGRNF